MITVDTIDSVNWIQKLTQAKRRIVRPPSPMIEAIFSVTDEDPDELLYTLISRLL